MSSIFQPNAFTFQVLRLALAGALILNSCFAFGQTFNQSRAQKIIQSRSSLEILGISESEFNSASASEKEKLVNTRYRQAVKNFFPDQSQAIALYGAGDQSALALLNHSTLLLALLRAGHMARACAHEFCRDEVDDFLAKDEFYEPLDANRITRLAAANLKEAVRLARAADDSAQAARDRQLSGGRV